MGEVGGGRQPASPDEVRQNLAPPPARSFFLPCCPFSLSTRWKITDDLTQLQRSAAFTENTMVECSACTLDRRTAQSLPRVHVRLSRSRNTRTQCGPTSSGGHALWVRLLLFSWIPQVPLPVFVNYKNEMTRWMSHRPLALHVYNIVHVYCCDSKKKTATCVFVSWVCIHSQVNLVCIFNYMGRSEL